MEKTIPKPKTKLWSNSGHGGILYFVLQLLPVATNATSCYNCYQLLLYWSLPVATSHYQLLQLLPAASSCYNCYQLLQLLSVTTSRYQLLPVASRWIQAVAVAFSSVAAGCHYMRIAVLFLSIHCYSKGVPPP